MEPGNETACLERRLDEDTHARWDYGMITRTSEDHLCVFDNIYQLKGERYEHSIR
ncbi:MAG: hypothetical protein K0S45_4343 [Nitrospira sp.]|jgi:hypothetical protein|nr:hypothetical protein [Nitrospira sp.]